ncbi:Uncharacterised protein [Serratia fonticola]|nr:Uncharacterised protein [Serratia fonticola]
MNFKLAALRVHALVVFVHPCTSQLGDKLTHPQELDFG